MTHPSPATSVTRAAGRTGRRRAAAGIGIGLVAAVLGCNREPEPGRQPLVRLLDALDAVRSPYAEALADGPRPARPDLELGTGMPWRTYSLARQFGDTDGADGAEPPPVEPWSDGRIPPGMGLAHVFDVVGRDGVEIRVEGTFAAASGMGARAVFLSTPAPAFVPRPDPGGLRRWVGAGLIGNPLRLETEEDVATLSTPVPSSARSVLLLVENTGPADATLRRMTAARLGPWRALFAASRPDPLFRARVDHGAIVRPSLVAPPGTTATTRPLTLAAGARVEVALAVLGAAEGEVRARVLARPEAGPARVLIDRTFGGPTAQWHEEQAVVPALDGPARVEFVCEATGSADGEDPPFLLFGAPLLTPPRLAPDAADSAGSRGSGHPAAPRRTNVLLIVLDTLRADRVGAYGGSGLTPAIDALAGDGVLFERAHAQSSYTLPTHVSLFTGLFPRTHGVEDFDQRIGPGTPLLTTLLAAAGYHTAAFNGGGLVSHTFGFDRGFDRYCEVDPLGGRYATGALPGGRVFPDGRTGSLDDALRFLDEAGDEPWFLFLHTYMAHSYLPEEALARRFGVDPAAVDASSAGRFTASWILENGMPEAERRRMAALYDATVVAADRMVGDVLDRLDELGLRDETLVILTADHGEELFDHGGGGHSLTLYEEVTRVPLVLRGPGLPAARRVAARARQVDVLPTVLELLGRPAPERLQGRSLLAALGERATAAPPVFARLRDERESVIENDYKLIRNFRVEAMRGYGREEPPVELYHLASDPGERRNLADVEPEIAALLAERLDAFDARSRALREQLEAEGMGGARMSLPAGVAENLQQLGYVVGGER